MSQFSMVNSWDLWILLWTALLLRYIEQNHFSALLIRNIDLYIKLPRDSNLFHFLEFQLVDLLNLICVTVDSRTKKFNVNRMNSVGEFASELIVLSGIPDTIGKLLLIFPSIILEYQNQNCDPFS